MMKTYTNITWPDDAYRTGQQLYRKPLPRLAAFTTLPPVSTGGAVTAAIVYLPLHRTRALAVTEQTVAFGFRTAAAADNADMLPMAAVTDLDLMQARRHAAILAGHALARDLAVLQESGNADMARGLAALQREWPDRRKPAPGRAQMFDCHLDLPGRPSLETACQHAHIAARLACDDTEPGKPEAEAAAAALAVERALAIALLCARHLDRYTWEETLDAAQIITASAWDCLPLLATGHPVRAAAGAEKELPAQEPTALAGTAQ
jgi:hypothetical protein